MGIIDVIATGKFSDYKIRWKLFYGIRFCVIIYFNC